MDITAHDNAGLLGGILVGRKPGAVAAAASSSAAPESERDIITIFQVGSLERGDLSGGAGTAEALLSFLHNKGYESYNKGCESKG